MQNRIWVQLEQMHDAGVTARWHLPDSIDDRLYSAGFDEFKSWLSALQTSDNEPFRAVLLLSGEQVVSRTVAFVDAEKKHLQKLLPFMLESQLAVDLSQVHVAHVLPDASLQATDKQSALVSYTDKKQLQWRIAELESLGLEVEEVFSIPAILSATGTTWRLLPDGDLCHLRCGNLLWASTESGILPTLLDIAIAGLASHTATSSVALVITDSAHSAVDESSHAQLQTRHLLQNLSEHAGIKAAGISIRLQQLTHAWACLDPHQKSAVNLRQGELAPPLRLTKRWRRWRVPAIAAMLAITAVLITAIIETQINQHRFRALDARIEQRYRDVMPEGVLVDAVQQLSAQVAQHRNAGASQSLISMLNAMLEPFENADSISLHRLSYNSSTQTSGTQTSGTQTEIQLDISAPSTTAILQLNENLTAAGWSAQARNISRTGDSQQANLLVRDNTP